MFRGDNWDELRKLCYERDNYTCRRCKKKFTEDKLHAHHIVPFRRGQWNSIINLITVCPSCHKKLDNNFIRLGLTHYMKDYIKENQLDYEIRLNGVKGCGAWKDLKEKQFCGSIQVK